MKLFYSILICCSTFFIALGQRHFVAPQMVPSPPSVASQLKYINMPVTEYNGTTNFSIPLYQLTDGDISVPISLSYYSNGLKTDEEASSVGLGWNLNAGGFIQFTQNNDMRSDNVIPRNVRVNPEYESDYQFNTIQRGCTFQTIDGQPVTFQNDSDLKYYPYEYPLYMYNFNGHSGKFIDINEGNLITIDRQNIKFKFLVTERGYKAITEDGTQYYFEDAGRGMTSKLNFHSPCSGIDLVPSQTLQDTYNLTKIISPTNKVVTFTYTSTVTKSLPALSQWYENSIENAQGVLYTSTYATHSEKVLSEINSTSVKIKFISSAREDISGGKKIDRIEIYKQGNTTAIKTINFETSYFDGVIGFGDFTTQNQVLGGCGIVEPQGWVTENFKKKRLKLNSVKFNNSRPYRFEYSPMPLPYKTSLAKDMWGYFNGAPNTSLLPNVNNLGYDDAEITNYFREHPFQGERRASSTYLQGGILTKIIQPTGGYTKMEYESNKFTTIPATQALINVPVSVTDIGIGKSIKEFTIPYVGYSYNVRINIHLNCLGPQYGCEIGNCPGYFLGTGIIGNQDNRLYILIQKKNPDGSWSDFSFFDRLSPEMGNNCTFDGYIALPPDSYRIIANFPDDLTTGLFGGPWADATITYKEFDTSPIASENIGGGLRIKSIIDYNSETDKHNERYYIYPLGKLITKPDFIYVFDSDVQGVSDNFSPTMLCTTIYHSSEFNNCSFTTRNTLHKETLYSDSILPFSYNASGALVGYSTVTVLFGQDGKFGKDVSLFTNKYDDIYTYPGMLPGVTGVRKPDNGLITEKFTYRNSTPLATFPIFDVVFHEKYEYEIKDYKKYWNHKNDYHPMTMVCLGEIVTSSLADLSRNYLHFYPIITAKVRLKSKLSTNYSYLNSETPNQIVTTKIDYQYNTHHQIISEKTTSSMGEIQEKKSFYPIDMFSQNIQTSLMQELIDNNRINQVIKTEIWNNNSKVFTQQYTYSKDSSTGNILLLKNVFEKKGSDSIDINASIDKTFTYVKYDYDLLNNVQTGNGNVLEYKQENGIPIAFIWGYNKRYIIAKIEGVSYEAFKTLVPPIQEVSNVDNDSCVSGCNEANLRESLKNFRNNVLFNNAMVTTYTYDPEVGVTSITAPNGLTEYYHYNQFNELIEIIDQWGNIVKQFSYYYRG